jgi:hypothetical protein
MMPVEPFYGLSPVATVTSRNVEWLAFDLLHAPCEIAELAGGQPSTKARFAGKHGAKSRRVKTMLESRASGRSRRALLVPAIVIVIAAGLGAEAKSPDGWAAEVKTPDRFSEFIKLSGLDTAFDLLAVQVKASMQQALPNSPLLAADQQKMLAAVDPAASAAFAPETLKRNFLLAIGGKLTNADLDKFLAFLKSPLGVRMTALEQASRAPDKQARIRKMAGELLERLKNDPERAKLLQRMDSSLRITEFATDIGFNVGRAVAIGMAAADEKTVSLPDEAINAIDAALQRLRPAMTQQVKEQILLSMTYTYREASIPELRQYLVFLTSPAGKRLYGVLVPAMNTVLTKAGSEFGHALMRELGKERA